LKKFKGETSAQGHFVILSEAKDLVFPYSYEILRPLRFLRMTSGGTFAGVSYQDAIKQVIELL
jgi:hypothetical protein